MVRSAERIGMPTPTATAASQTGASQTGATRVTWDTLGRLGHSGLSRRWGPLGHADHLRHCWQTFRNFSHVRYSNLLVVPLGILGRLITGSLAFANFRPTYRSCSPWVLGLLGRLGPKGKGWPLDVDALRGALQELSSNVLYTRAGARMEQE